MNDFASAPAWLKAKLEDLENQAKGTKLGKEWRVIEGPFPTQDANSCVQLQHRDGTNWVTKAAFEPDGTDALACVAMYSNGAGTFVVTNNTYPMHINFSTKIRDTDNAVTTGASWSFKCPVGKGGLYMVSAVVSMTGIPAATNYDATMAFWVNSAELIRGPRLCSVSANVGGIIGLHASHVVPLSAGDVFQAPIFQNSGANRTLIGEAWSNRIHIARLPFIL